MLEAYYAQVMANHAPARRMSLENAELAKISVNSFVTMKITFANMLAALCEAIPGADVDVVTQALGSDRRIGARYLTGGLGYGGPCFPRDNVALAFLARALGTPALGPEATDAANVRIPARVVARIAPLVPTGGTVGLLGLAYKPASHVIEAAQGAALAEACLARGLRVVAFDPLVTALPGRDGVQMAGERRRGRRGGRRRRDRDAGPGVRRARLGRRCSPVDRRWRSSTRGGCCAIAFPRRPPTRYHVLGRGPAPGRRRGRRVAPRRALDRRARAHERLGHDGPVRVAGVPRAHARQVARGTRDAL